MKKYTQYFISGTRNDGASYLYLNNEAPVELGEFVREVHMEFDCAPNDWIYDQIYEALSLAEEGNDLIEMEVEADPYHGHLKAWTLEPFADSFINYMLERDRFSSLFDLLSAAQGRAIGQIYSLTHCFIDEHNEEEAE